MLAGPRFSSSGHSLTGFLALALALGAASLAGPSTAPAAAGEAPGSPEAVARSFMEAGKASDKDAFLALLTEAARAQMTETGPGAGGPQGEYRIDAAMVEGDSARVPVTVNEAGTEQTAAIHMRREGGAWRVYGVGFLLPDGGTGFFIDFEHPEAVLEGLVNELGEAMGDALGQGLEQAFGGGEPAPPLSAVDLAAFEAAWQQHGGVEGAASEVMDAVAAPLGFDTDWSNAPDAMSAAVTVDREGRSALQVIDEIARQAGVHPSFEYGTLVLVPGPRPAPVVFAGPFMLEVSGLREYAPHASGALEVTMRGAGLPEGVMAHIDGQYDHLVIDAVEDASGRPLFDPELPASMGGGSGGDGFHAQREIELRGLLRDVTAIAKLAAHFEAELPTAVETLRFDTLEDGQSASSGEVTVTLARVDQGYGSYGLDIRGASAERIQVVPLDASGSEMPVVSRSSSGFGDEAALDISTEGPAAALEVRMVSATGTVRYDFTLQDVPLEHASGQPAAIAAPRFEGASPVTAEVTSIQDDGTFRSLHVAMANRSDKAVRRVQFRMVYLDDAGNRLGDWQADQDGPTGDREPEAPPVLAGAGEKAEFELTAFFMPDEATRATVEVTAVRFMDGSEWAP